MKMMIKVSIDRFDKVLKEEIPSDYEKVYKDLLRQRLEDTKHTYISLTYSPEYERYCMIDKIRKITEYVEGDYIYVDYGMVCWMEEEGL